MPSEVGSAQVAIFPIFPGFRKAVVANVDAATAQAGTRFERGFGKSARATGTSAGRGFSKSFNETASDLNSGALKQLSREVASASAQLSTNRLKELDALGKVRVATAQVDEATAKYGETNSRTIAASERLASAQRGLAVIQASGAEATSRLTTAQLALKTANDAINTSTVVTGNALTRFFVRARQNANDFSAGFYESRLGLSAFTGAFGTFGRTARLALQPAILGADALNTAITNRLQPGLNVIRRFSQGFNDFSVASSRFSGIVGTLGGRLAKVVAGFNDSQAAASVFTGRLGTLGGLARTVLNPGINSVGRFRDGFNSSSAAASKFSGIFGSLGGITSRVSSALTTGIGGIFSFLGSAGKLGGAGISAVGSGLSGLVPIAQRAGAGIASAFSVVRSSVGSVASGIGSAFSSGMSSAVSAVSSGLATIGKLSLGAGVAAAAGIGGILAKGFSRLSSIETAQAKLTALGNTAEDVATIMTNANDAVIGTQYSLADAVTGAAAAVAAGIKPGVELEDYLKTTANAAAIAGVNFNDLGLVMNQVQAQNKAYTQDINQVASRGIPIYAALAKVYGVNQEELRGMLQKGEIDAAHFQQALKESVGDGAVAIGQTTIGAFKNMGAAISRFGARVLTPIYPLFKGLFDIIRIGFDVATIKIGPFADKFGGALRDKIQPFFDKVLDVLQRIKDGTFTFDFAAAFPGLYIAITLIKTLFDTLQPVIEKVLPVLKDAVVKIGGALGDAVQKIADSGVIQVIADAFVELVDAIIPLIPQIVDLVPVILTLLPPLLDLVIQVLPPLVDLLKIALPAAVAILSVALRILAPIIAGVIQWAAGFYEALGDLVSYINGDFSVQTLIDKITSIKGPFGDVMRVVTDFGLGLGSTIRDATLAVVRFTYDTAANIGRFIDIFVSVPGRVLDAIGTLNNTLFTAGASLIDGFINGIKSKIQGLSGVLTTVLDFAKGFFPHSPAKRGPFSGSGWTQLKRSGGAIVTQFSSGIEDAAAVDAAISTLLTVPRSATTVSNVTPITSASSSSDGSGNVYVGTIVAPDQNPAVSGRIIAEEFKKRKAG